MPLTDEEIISRIEWNVNVAAHAKGGPRFGVSANVPPLKPGDKPVGEAHTFRMGKPDKETGIRKTKKKAVEIAVARVQAAIVERYRLHNEQGALQQEDPPQKTLEQQLIEAAEFR